MDTFPHRRSSNYRTSMGNPLVILPGKAFAAISALTLLLTACQAAGPAPGLSRTGAPITPADVRSRIYLIADDSMAGRAAGETGNFTMTSYLAREVERFGLEPGGDNGTYFQTIPMVRRWVDSSSTLKVAGQPLGLFDDFALIRPTTSIPFASQLENSSLETVYGGRAGDTTIALTENAVRGKLVVLDAPLGANAQPSATYATPSGRALARYPTAAGIAVVVLDLLSENAAAGLRNRGSGLSSTSNTRALPVGFLVTRSVAERIMGRPLSTLSPGTQGQQVSANVRFAERPVDVPARNVVAILRGSDPALRGEFIAIGAHSDHIARAMRAVDHDSLKAYNRVVRPNGADSRVASTSPVTPEQWREIRTLIDGMRKLRPPRLDSIYNGADDDGSGSVALLEIAESLPRGVKPRRSILFVWHTAEEAGLLGSAYFMEHTTVPHDSIVAQLNMDMVGRGMAVDTRTGGPRNLQVIGSRRLSTALGKLLDSVNLRSAAPYAIDYSFDVPGHIQNRYCRSDHYMYARSGIPIAYISRGYHPDYHMVTDEPQYISYDGLARVAGFVRDVAVALANRNDRVRVDRPKPNPLAPCIQ